MFPTSFTPVPDCSVGKYVVCFNNSSDSLSCSLHAVYLTVLKMVHGTCSMHKEKSRCQDHQTWRSHANIIRGSSLRIKMFAPIHISLEL